MKKVLLLLLILSLYSCKSGQAPAEEFAKAFISMERTACYGKCPVYKITIYGTGKAAYEGQANVAKKGTFQKTISKKDVVNLFNAFEKASFFDFNNEYTGQYSDLPPTYLTYQNKNEIKKTIKDYWKAPDELKNLEKMVDEIANTEGWEPQQELK